MHPGTAPDTAPAECGCPHRCRRGLRMVWRGTAGQGGAMVRTWLSRSHSGAREIAGLAALYGLYEVVRGAGGENVQVAMQNTADIVAFEHAVGLYVERGVQRAFEAVPYRAGAARAALRAAPLRGDGNRARVDPPAASRPVPDRPHDVRRRNGARARRLRLLSRRAAAARRARVLRHGDQLDRPRPELRPAGRALQPVRRRPEPPLRLRADRRCRSRGNRRPGAGCGSSARSTRPRCS